jgi:hypothetical protein
MKKLMLIVAFAGVASFAFAQKPSSGSITTEIGLTSVIGTPSNTANPAGLAQGVLRGRYFMSEKMAVRASFGVGMGSTTTILTGGAADQETVVKTSGFALGLGLEKHLAGTTKLSPYVGAEFGFGIAGGSTEVTNLGGVNTDKSTTTGGGTTNLRLNALIGADYYIVEGVYIGAELGIGLFGSSTTADTETETVIGGATVKVTAPGSTGSNFGINPNALGLVRIGLLF